MFIQGRAHPRARPRLAWNISCRALYKRDAYERAQLRRRLVALRGRARACARAAYGMRLADRPAKRAVTTETLRVLGSGWSAAGRGLAAASAQHGLERVGLTVVRILFASPCAVGAIFDPGGSAIARTLGRWRWPLVGRAGSRAP